MKINLKNIAVILNEPHYPENIGAAARAAKNMGIGRLIVVNPIDFDLERVQRMATHAAGDLVDSLEFSDSLRDALAPYGYIVGTTARKGSHRQMVHSPREMASKLAPISQENEIAVVFGTESRGLTNEDIRYCDALVTIPTADFSSLNLAQAVMVLAYELFMAECEPPAHFVPRLASSRELEGMYDHLKDTLAMINFINPENPEYWMMSVRRFFSRIGLRAREVRIVRGICRQIDWYCTKRGKGEASPVAENERCPDRETS